jgi:hypothetical protein
MKMPDTVLRSKATLTTPCPSRASTTRSDARRTGILFMNYSITIIENDAHRVSEAEIVVSCTMYEGILGDFRWGLFLPRPRTALKTVHLPNREEHQNR